MFIWRKDFPPDSYEDFRVPSDEPESERAAKDIPPEKIANTSDFFSCSLTSPRFNLGRKFVIKTRRPCVEEYQKLRQEKKEALREITAFYTARKAEAVALRMSSARGLLHDNKELDEELDRAISEYRLAEKRLSDYWKTNKRRLKKEEAVQAEQMTLRQMIDGMIRTNRALAKFEQKHVAKHPKGKVSDCHLCEFEWEDLDTAACQARSLFDKHSIGRPAEWWTLTSKKPKR